jgi:signal peptidase
METGRSHTATAVNGTVTSLRHPMRSGFTVAAGQALYVPTAWSGGALRLQAASEPALAAVLQRVRPRLTLVPPPPPPPTPKLIHPAASSASARRMPPPPPPIPPKLVPRASRPMLAPAASSPAPTAAPPAPAVFAVAAGLAPPPPPPAPALKPPAVATLRATTTANLAPRAGTTSTLRLVLPAAVTTTLTRPAAPPAVPKPPEIAAPEPAPAAPEVFTDAVPLLSRRPAVLAPPLVVRRPTVLSTPPPARTPVHAHPAPLEPAPEPAVEPTPAPSVVVPRTRRATARFVTSKLFQWAAFGGACALVLALFGPYLFGGRTFTVMSGSMEPTINTGDAIIVTKEQPEKAKIGDIVTFRDPDGTKKLITHRVRRITIGGGTVSFVTKGDNSNATQKWAVPMDGSIGLVRYRIPKLGYGAVWARTPLGRLFLLVIPVSLLGMTELRRIWRPSKPEAASAQAA